MQAIDFPFSLTSRLQTELSWVLVLLIMLFVVKIFLFVYSKVGMDRSVDHGNKQKIF